MSKANQQRDQRLAAALRDNLKRRKTQSRESEPDPQPPVPQTSDENHAASE